MIGNALPLFENSMKILIKALCRYILVVWADFPLGTAMNSPSSYRAPLKLTTLFLQKSGILASRGDRKLQKQVHKLVLPSGPFQSVRRHGVVIVQTGGRLCTVQSGDRTGGDSIRNSCDVWNFSSTSRSRDTSSECFLETPCLSANAVEYISQLDCHTQSILFPICFTAHRKFLGGKGKVQKH